MGDEQEKFEFEVKLPGSDAFENAKLPGDFIRTEEKINGHTLYGELSHPTKRFTFDAKEVDDEPSKLYDTLFTKELKEIYAAAELALKQYQEAHKLLRLSEENMRKALDGNRCDIKVDIDLSAPGEESIPVTCLVKMDENGEIYIINEKYGRTKNTI